MPIYTHDELSSSARAPWVEVVDWTWHFLERTRRKVVNTDDQLVHWGTSTDEPRPLETVIEPRATHDRVFVTAGEITVESSQGRFRLNRRDYFDVPPGGAKLTSLGYSTAEFIHISGEWDEIVRSEICAFGPGFPCDYHFHDGHEYWFPYQGHFTLQYDERDHPMDPSRMLAARRGHEHGVSAPEEEFRAVVIATGLSEPHRDGHLVRALHGDPIREGDEG